MALKPVEMAQVRVIGLRKDMPGLVTALHEAGIVEIRETEAGTLPKDTPGGEYGEISEQLVRLRGIETHLKKGGGEHKGRAKQLPLDKLLAEARAVDVDSRLVGLSKEADAIRERKRHLSEARNVLSPLRDVKVDFTELKKTSLAFHLGTLGNAKFAQFRKAVSNVTTRHGMVSRPKGDRRTCLIAIEKGVELSGIFGEAGFIEMDVSSLEGTPAAIIASADSEIAALEKRAREVEQELGEISRKHHHRIAQLVEMLEVEADRAEIVARFGRTEELFVLEGYVPKKDHEKLLSCLKGAVGWKFVLQEKEAGHGAPTLLEHGKATGPMQFLVEFYSLPVIGELDPTNILFFTFPILYGMMLGDVGYGIASFLVAYALLRKFPGGLLAGFSKLWMYAAIPSIAFGVLFDEWMGFTHSHLIEVLGLGHFVEGLGFHLPLYHGMSRIENITTLFALALIVGVIHILFGFALGAYNDWGHHRKHAYAKMGWIAVVVGGVLAVATMFFGAFPPEYLPYFGASFAAGLLVVIVFEGPLGMFEVPGLIGNTLSYLRIAGVGLAGVVPAEFMINKLLLPDMNSGILVFVIMVPIYVMLHAVNILLAMVESLVQGARLNLVEFYSKFYKGGGRKFSPFRVERSITEN